MKEIKITWGRNAKVDESVQTSHHKSLNLGTTTVSISSKGPDKSKKIKPRTNTQNPDTPKPRPVRPRPKSDPGVMAFVSIGRKGDLRIFGPEAKPLNGNYNRLVRGGRGVYKSQRFRPKVYDVVIEGEQGERTVNTGLAYTVRIRIA